MIDNKTFSLEIEGNDVIVCQIDKVHASKSRYFGRIRVKEDSLRATRGFVFEEEDIEDLVVGEFEGPHAFLNALEAIMEEYDEFFTALDDEPVDECEQHFVMDEVKREAFMKYDDALGVKR